MKKLSCAFILAISAVVPCFAADSPWNGTWKLNPDKSKLTGHTMTYTLNPDGSFRYSSGEVSYNITCDGKPFSTAMTNRVATCTGSPSAGYETTTTINGKVAAKSRRTFPPDGKTMKYVLTSMNADGSTSTGTYTYQRTSGTTGLVGSWVAVKSNPAKELMKISIDNDHIRMEDPITLKIFDARLDGSFAPETGPTANPDSLVSFKSAGPRKLLVQEKLKGKVIMDGTEMLGDDGKTLVEEYWSPGKENEKQTYFWEKQ